MKQRARSMTLVTLAGLGAAAMCAAGCSQPLEVDQEQARQLGETAGGLAGTALAGPGGAAIGVAAGRGLVDLLFALGVIGAPTAAAAYTHSRGRHVGFDEGVAYERRKYVPNTAVMVQ